MRIAQIQIIINFQIDHEIVLTVGESIKNLQKSNKVNVQILNVPKSAPPEAPRMIVISQNAIINICLNRYLIVLKLPKHISSEIRSTFEYVKSVTSELLTFLIYEDFHYNWTGLITNLEYTLSKGEQKSLEVISPYFDKLINIKRNDKKLSSFQLQFGFEENGYLKNYTLSGYDKFNIILPINIPFTKFISIDKNQAKVIESGVQIIIDINNKTLINKNEPKIDYINIITEVIKSYENLPNILNIEGLLK